MVSVDQQGKSSPPASSSSLSSSLCQSLSPKPQWTLLKFQGNSGSSGAGRDSGPLGLQNKRGRQKEIPGGSGQARSPSDSPLVFIGVGWSLNWEELCEDRGEMDSRTRAIHSFIHSPALHWVAAGNWQTVLSKDSRTSYLFHPTCFSYSVTVTLSTEKWVHMFIPFQSGRVCVATLINRVQWKSCYMTYNFRS